MAQMMGAAGMAAAVVLLLVAAWQDFTTWKIRNWTVLALVALYALMQVADLVGSTRIYELALVGDLGAASLLFSIGVGLWLAGLFGAGDAKLFFPIGLFVGFHNMLLFGLILAIAGIIVAIVLRFPVPLRYQGMLVFYRLEEIRKTGKIPYGVVMVAAALLAMNIRFEIL